MNERWTKNDSFFVHFSFIFRSSFIHLSFIFYAYSIFCLFFIHLFFIMAKRNLKAFDTIKRDCIDNPKLLQLPFKELCLKYPNLKSDFGIHNNNQKDLNSAQGIVSNSFLYVIIFLTIFYLYILVKYYVSKRNSSATSHCSVSSQDFHAWKATITVTTTATSVC